MAKNETEEEKKARAFVEEIATNIAKLSRQVTALLSGRVKKETIIILIANSTRLPQQTVMQVLNAIEGLENKHLN